MDRGNLDRSWRPERGVTIADALDGLLERLERLYSEPGDAADAPARRFRDSTPPLPSGLDALDLLCGGLPRGAVTVIEADQPAQARALIATAASRAAAPTLLSVEAVGAMTPWLLAASTQVPAVCIGSGYLSEHDWNAITARIGKLGSQPLRLTDAESLAGLTHVVREQSPAVLLVSQLGRFGEPCRVVSQLQDIALAHGVGVLATAPPLGDLPPSLYPGLTCVRMVSYGLAGHAALVRSDSEQPLAVQHVDVDIITAHVA